MRKKIKKGIIIVFEGIDGSGKTTQAQILSQELLTMGFNVVLFKEPSSGKWGRKIKNLSLINNSITPEEELELFLKDRKENIKKNIKPALDKRKIVLLDRYYFSNIAYQGAKGIDIELIKSLNRKIAIEPDLVFIFDVEPKIGLARIENRKKREKLFEREDYLEKVREIFNSLNDEKIIKIDASKSIKEIAQKIKKIVLDYIENFII